MSVALMFLLLGLWFMIWVAYKPVYDGQETANKLTDWAQPYNESFNIAPGLFLCFLEIVVFVAISVAISTRMGMWYLDNLFRRCFLCWTTLTFRQRSVATQLFRSRTWRKCWCIPRSIRRWRCCFLLFSSKTEISRSRIYWHFCFACGSTLTLRVNMAPVNSALTGH